MRRLSDRQDKLAETQDRISLRLDAQDAKQNKDRKYLKDIMKFLRCFEKGEGSSVAAYKYLDHSDSPMGVMSSTPFQGLQCVQRIMAFIILLRAMAMAAWGSFRVLLVALDSDDTSLFIILYVSFCHCIYGYYLSCSYYGCLLSF
ncbi:hypothetical protein LIER_29636 [Lithospermum erythrorhizon]|uniref:Uncharacterized protein n=1 Tax=Lithospermum erythrorhizon TaxID=34254 RepID=A0AAV3RNV6_LITER